MTRIGIVQSEHRQWPDDMKNQRRRGTQCQHIRLERKTDCADPVSTKDHRENQRQPADCNPQAGQRHPKRASCGGGSQPAGDLQRECIKLVFSNLRPVSRIDFGMNPIERRGKPKRNRQ